MDKTITLLEKVERVDLDHDWEESSTYSIRLRKNWATTQTTTNLRRFQYTFTHQIGR